MMPFFTVYKLNFILKLEIENYAQYKMKLSTKKMKHYLNDNTWDFCSQMFGNKMG